MGKHQSVSQSVRKSGSQSGIHRVSGADVSLLDCTIWDADGREQKKFVQRIERDEKKEEEEDIWWKKLQGADISQRISKHAIMRC